MADSSRWEVRKLEPKHADAVRAILAIAETFDSPIWPRFHPRNKPAGWIAYKLFDSHRASVDRQIESNLSYGLFDRQHNPTSSPFAEGDPDPHNKVYWSKSESPWMNRAELLRRINTPLVSVVLCHDSTNPLRDEDYLPLTTFCPQLKTIKEALEALNHIRYVPPPNRSNDIVWCSGVYTRAGFGRQGHATKLSKWLMREMARRRYRVINIFSAHPAHTRIWQSTEAPFIARLVSTLGPQTTKVVINGSDIPNPLHGSTGVACKRIHVYLSPVGDVDATAGSESSKRGVMEVNQDATENEHQGSVDRSQPGIANIQHHEAEQ